MKNKKWKYLLLIFVCFVIAVIANYQFWSLNRQYAIKDTIMGTETTDAENIEQIITAQGNDFSKIYLYFNKMDENELNKVKVTITNVDTNEKIYEKKMNSDMLVNGSRKYNEKNQYFELSFKKQKDSYQQKYKVEITNNKAIQFVYTNQSKSEIIMDKETKEGTLGYSLGYYSQTNIVIFYIILCLLLVIFLILSNFCFSKDKIKIENWFLLCASFIYLLYVVFIPLYAAHDEIYHFLRAYEVSEGKIFSTVHNGKVESLLPLSISNSFAHDYTQINYRTTLDSLKSEHVEGKQYYDTSTVAVYSPVQYLPQSIGIKISSIFTNNIVIQAYFARLCNMIISILLLYLAIKIIPFGKKILFALSFSPIAIEGFTSISADAITLSVTFLLLAYILSLMKESTKLVTKKNYIILFLLSFVLALCKIVYIPLVALIFLLPLSKFKDKKHYMIFTFSIVIFSVILNLGWLSVASSFLNVAKGDASSVQLHLILTTPFKYLGILLYTFSINFHSYLMTAFGSELCWAHYLNFSIVPYGMIVATLLAVFSDKQLVKSFNIKNNLLIGIIALMISGLIFTSLFMQFTKVGSVTIAGVQGRYFLPILPLLLFMLGNIKFNFSNKTNCDRIIVVLCLIFNLMTLFNLFNVFA